MNDTARINALLSTLATSRERETELLAQLDALLKQPADLPAHVTRVVAQAREVLDEDAVRWLSRAHYSLGHQTPLECAQTAEGAQRVEDLLTRIAVGLPV